MLVPSLRAGASSAATLSLCLCAVTHAYLLFSFFPYAGYMSVSLLSSSSTSTSTAVTLDSVGVYVGLLSGAFTAGRAIGFVPWKAFRSGKGDGGKGGAGVKRTLLCSLFLSAACSVWFGLSRAYASALVARFALGMSNALSGCVKRAAIDLERAAALARKDNNNNNNNGAVGDGEGGDDAKVGEHFEPEKSQARVLAVMWWGTALGPCVGGLLSYPGTYCNSHQHPLLERFPFLLPNVAGAALCLLSMAAVAAFVVGEEEEKEKEGTTRDRTGENRPLLVPPETTATATSNAGPAATAAPCDAASRTGNTWEDAAALWEAKSTRDHLIAYWCFSFVVVCVDEALPLFLVARMWGPGLSERPVGWILSASGLVVALGQTMHVADAERRIFSEDGLGLYSGLRLGAVMGNLPAALVPAMLALNGGTYYNTMTPSSDGEEAGLEGEGVSSLFSGPGILTWGAFLFLAALLGATRLFVSLYFSLIGVAAGRTAPLSHRDYAARVMTLGALLVRAAAHVAGGALATAFLSSSSPPSYFHLRHASAALWSTIGLLLGSGAAAFTFALKEGGAESTARSNKRRSIYLDKRAPIYEELWDDEEDEDGGDSTTASANCWSLVRKVIAMNRPQQRSDNSHPAVVSNEEEPGLPQQTEQRHKRRTTWVDHVVRPGIDLDEVPFIILGTSKHDKSVLPHVLTPPLMKALHQHLPPACAGTNFWLKYSLVRDGGSILALQAKTGPSKHTFVVIETLKGDVFGCFMAKPWKNTNKYERCGESFLWRMKKRRTTTLPDMSPTLLDEIAHNEGDIEVFWWTGENELCMLLADDKIAAGGGTVGRSGAGFGFALDGNLTVGSSGPCLTYGNPCLVGDDSGKDGGMFEVANMEIWAMTPHFFVADAEKCERSMKENIMDQSAWANFL